MNKNLKKVLWILGEEYKDSISGNARNYIEINLGEKAEKLGLYDVKNQFNCANAIIPIKHPVRGMKVRIDGRTFVNYGQFDSGVAVPGYVAKESGLPYKTYIPNDSMLLNFN